MKKSIFFILLFSSVLTFGQTDYYCFNTDSIFAKEAVLIGLDSINKTMQTDYEFTPIIYHRVFRGDSIINYLTFVAGQKDSLQSDNFIFRQDSIFLLLNNRLPDFELTDLSGNLFNSRQLIGKPTLINYWSTGCKPCIEEIPKLNELKEKFGDKMNFIAISPASCNKNQTISFLEKRPFNFIQLEETYYSKEKLKNKSMPRNIFVDKNGIVRYIQGNFPYSIDMETGNKIYEDNNYFYKIINELIKKQ